MRKSCIIVLVLKGLFYGYMKGCDIMVIKQPNGKYCLPYDKQINLSKDEVFDILMKRAEENIKHDLENCGDLHDFIKNTRTFNKIKIKNSTLKSMGCNGTFETLILETPTKPCFSPMWDYLSDTQKEISKRWYCPNCGNGLDNEQEKCSCGQMIEW